MHVHKFILVCGVQMCVCSWGGQRISSIVILMKTIYFLVAGFLIVLCLPIIVHWLPRELLNTHCLYLASTVNITHQHAWLCNKDSRAWTQVLMLVRPEPSSISQCVYFLIKSPNLYSFMFGNFHSNVKLIHIILLILNCG